MFTKCLFCNIIFATVNTIGITPHKTMVYTEFYYGFRLYTPKVNNYYEFFSKAIIVTTAIINPAGYADFTHELFLRLINPNRRHNRSMLECNFIRLNMLEFQ